MAAALPAAAQDAPAWPEVQKLFAAHCTACHAGKDAPLDLRLDTLEHALKGSANGPVLKPGDAAGSELLRRVRGESEPRMPLTGPPFLADSEIALIERWVAAGLPAGDAAAAAQPEAAEQPRPGPGEVATFAHVAPIFMKRCAKCHKDNGKMGYPPEGLRLDSYAAILASGERSAVIPGNSGLSEIVRRVEGKAQKRMPFDGPPWLDDDDIRLLRQWIEQGARDAEGKPAPMPAGRYVRFRGRMTGEGEIDGASVVITGATRIDKVPRIGDEIEVRGIVQESGDVRVDRLRRR